jgi:hypothetical protein
MKPIFNPAEFMPAWAANQGAPMTAALYFILRLADLAPAVPLKFACLRHPGTPHELMFVLRGIEAGGENGLSPTEILKLLPRLRGENANAQRPANILIRPDPSQAHPWLFLDDLPTPRARALCKKFAGLVVETSANNSQVRLLSDRDLTQNQRMHAQHVLQARLGCDPNSTSGEKWGRLPGFKNKKPSRGDAWTNLIYDTTEIRAPISFHALVSSISSPGGVCAPASISPSPGAPSAPAMVSLSSFSISSPRTKAGFAREALARPLPNANEHQAGWRQEFADACQALRAGLPNAEIVAMLATRALERGKRRTPVEAVRYAEHVLGVAQQYQDRAA